MKKSLIIIALFFLSFLSLNDSYAKTTANHNQAETNEILTTPFENTDATLSTEIQTKDQLTENLLKPAENNANSSEDDNVKPTVKISHGDLWLRLRRDFRLDHHRFNFRVAKQLHWYLNHQSKLYYALNNAAPYLYYIVQETRQRRLPGEFALLPVIESAYDPFARSRSGATGLWQLMPMTAHGFDIKHNYWYDGRRDVIDSTRAALSYLTYLGNYFNDDWLLASAAYNAGEGTVSQAIQRNALHGKRTDFWSLPLPHETQDYVPRLLAMALIIDHPNRYGVVLPAVDNYPYFDQVTVKTQIELKQAAKLAKVSSNEIEQLNAGFSRHRTAPATVSRLNLPIEKVEEFKQNLETYIATHKNITHVATKKKSSSHRKTKRKHTAKKVAKKTKIARHTKKRHHIAKKNNHRVHRKIG